MLRRVGLYHPNITCFAFRPLGRSPPRDALPACYDPTAERKANDKSECMDEERRFLVFLRFHDCLGTALLDNHGGVCATCQAATFPRAEPAAPLFVLKSASFPVGPGHFWPTLVDTAVARDWVTERPSLLLHRIRSSERWPASATDFTWSRSVCNGLQPVGRPRFISLVGLGSSGYEVGQLSTSKRKQWSSVGR